MTALADLPQFTITSVSGSGKSARVTGYFDRLHGVAEGRCWLFTRHAESASGSLVELDANAKTAVFITSYPTQLTTSVTLPHIDGYWRASIVEIVLGDRPARKQIFKPHGAATYHYEGGRILKRAADVSAADGRPEQIVAGSWDHEHCKICWAHIDPGQVGYADDEDHWLCESCYQQFVVPHDLSFMENHGRRWSE